MRLLELACMPRGRARERSLLVAEQLGFDQLRRNSGAVQRNEGSRLARALVMNGTGDQLLAGARLAQDADSRFAGGHAAPLAP